MYTKLRLKWSVCFFAFVLFSVTCFCAEQKLIPISAEFLIGAWDGSDWKNADEIAASISAGVEYSVYSFDKKEKSTMGNKPDMQEVPGQYFTIKFSEEGEFTPNFKIGGTWNALLRKPKLQKGGLSAYEKEVADLLKKNNVKAKPQILQVIRIDLDGNGTDEVFVVAANVNAKIPIFEQDTYSLVIFRRLVAGKVKSSIIHEHYYKESKSGEADSPNGYEIPFLLDVNNDGSIETIIRGHYYEGFWYEIHEFDGEDLHLRLSNGIGA
jgi:hypothetical protein